MQNRSPYARTYSATSAGSSSSGSSGGGSGLPYTVDEQGRYVVDIPDIIFTGNVLAQMSVASAYAGGDTPSSVFDMLPYDASTLGWLDGKLTVIGGSGGGLDSSAMWEALGGSVTNQVVALSHLPASLVQTTDARLSNARPASDVYSWAKAASKPSYTWSEIGSKPTWIGSSKPSYTASEVGALASNGTAADSSKLGGVAAANFYHSGNSNLSTVDWSAKTLNSTDLNLINNTTTNGQGPRLRLGNTSTSQLGSVSYGGSIEFTGYADAVNSWMRARHNAYTGFNNLYVGTSGILYLEANHTATGKTDNGGSYLSIKNQGYNVDSLPILIGGYYHNDSKRQNICFQPEGGNIGIGILSPGERLAIDGTLRYKTYARVSSGNDANFSYIRHYDITSNTSAMVLGTCYGYNVEAEAAYLYEGKMALGMRHNPDRLNVNGSIRLGNIDDSGDLNVALGSSTKIRSISNQGWRDINRNHISSKISFHNINAFQANNALSQGGAISFWTAVSGNGTENGAADLTECRMFISNSGNIGIGITSPTEKLHVGGNILATGNCAAASDRRLKSDIRPLEFRGSLRPYSFVKNGVRDIGFIAQEARELYPELVIGEEAEDNYLGLNYAGYTAVLQAQIDLIIKKLANNGIK